MKNVNDGITTKAFRFKYGPRWYVRVTVKEVKIRAKVTLEDRLWFNKLMDDGY